MGRDAIENLWHDVVVGIVGLSPQLVRPAYQAEPAAIPEHSVDWAAIDCHPAAAINYPIIRHVPDGEGHDLVVDDVRWDVLVMMLGPRADDLALELRSGLQVEQNRAALRQTGVALISVDNPVSVPSLDDQVWRRRSDLMIHTIVRSSRRYEVLNLLSSAGTVGRGSFDTEGV